MSSKKTKIVLSVATLILLIIALTTIWCFTNLQFSGDKTIRIVGSFPMQTVSVGQEIVNGIKLALEEEDYRVGDYTIEFEVLDDGDSHGRWQESLEIKNAELAVSDPRTMIYLGPFNSGAAKVSIPITNNAGLAQLSPGNTWPGLTQAGFLPGEPGIFYPTGVRNYFRVCPTDALQGPAGAVWMKELGGQTVYIVDDGDAYGKGIASLFEKKAKELGLEVIGHDTLSEKFSVEMAMDIVSSNSPDFIYFGGITPSGGVDLAVALGKSGLPVKLMGPDGIMDQSFIDQAGSYSEGVYVTVVGLPAEDLGEKGKKFAADYFEAYQKEPGSYSAFGYESAKVSLLAIENSVKKDRASILESLSEIRNYNGLLGQWSFDENGDTDNSLISGNRVENQSFVFDKLLDTK